MTFGLRLQEEEDEVLNCVGRVMREVGLFSFRRPSLVWERMFRRQRLA
jgi:hypothetical protein